MKVVVVGGTGRCGQPVVRHLLATGHEVRVPTRDPDAATALAEAGAELVRLDLTASPRLPRSLLARADRLHLITTSQHGFNQEVQVGRSVVRAAVVAGVAHVVFQSVTWAASTMPHCATKGQIEGELARSELPWTSLRAGYFTETLRDYLTPPAHAERRLISVIAPYAPVWWVAIDELAHASATVLTLPVPPTGVCDAVAARPMSFAALTAQLSSLTRDAWTCVHVPMTTAQLLSGAVASGFMDAVEAERWLRRHPYLQHGDYHAPINHGTATPDPAPLEAAIGFKFQHPSITLSKLLASSMVTVQRAANE